MRRFFDEIEDIMALDDSKLARDVVDRLKKQGLFDKFRKECMADVDTKPAYQNLTHRVQVAVEQFLSSQIWHPDLNKNQLRESLRRHLNDLQMLSAGVDRVVDQVINTKVISDVKPQVDRVICEYLGVDYDKWMERQKARWQQPVPASVPTLTSYVPNLLDLHVQGLARASFALNADVSLPPPSVLPRGMPLLPLPSSNLPPSSLPAGVLLPRTGGPVSGVLPASDLAGVRPSLPIMSAPAHKASAPLFPFPDMSLISSVPPPPLGHMNVSDAAPLNATEPLVQFPPTATSSFNPGISRDYVSLSAYYSGYPDQPYHSTENTSNFPALPSSISSSGIHFGVGSSGERFLGDEPVGFGHQEEDKPAPMTKTARDREARAKKKQRKQAMEPLSVESFLGLSMSKPSAEDNTDKDKETVTDEVKQEKEPATVQVQNEDVVSHAEEVSGKVEDIAVSVIVIDESALPAGKTADGESKEYHFDWDAMDNDQMSDISVSSVHTSDLSSFDDDAEQAVSSDAEADDVISEASPMKDLQVEVPCNKPDAIVKDLLEVSEDRQQTAKKPFALELRFGDSDSEETREHRKARMAKEKADRYLRRQQRRAELEQKRREKSTVSENIPSSAVSINTSEMESQSEVGGPDDSNVDEKLSSGTIQQSPVRKAMQMDSGAVSEDSPMKSGSERGTRRRTKAQLKEELREKKVQEKQCELRRQRTRNRKYISDDFTSIFTEKKNLLASSGYVDDAKREAENVEEEVVDPNDEAVIIVEDAENVVEECVEVGSSSSSDSDYSPRNRSRRYDSDSDSRPGSPYSDISHSSTVYSISSETSEASSGKHSHSEQSRSAASQPSSQKETSRQSWSPPEARKLPYTRDKYRDGSSPYGRLQNRESESPWRSRHESSYSTSDGRTYSPVKNRPDSRTEIRMYHHESPHALKHPETSPMNTRRRHAYARGHRSDGPESSVLGDSRQTQQRYSTTELYKPQTARRRSPSANVLYESHEWHAKPGSRRIDRERSRPCSQHYTHSPVHSVTGRSPDTKLDVGHRESPATSPRSRHVLSPGSSSRTRHGTAYRSRSPDYDYKKSRDWTVGSDYEMSQQQYSTSMVDDSSEASYGCAVQVNVYEHSRMPSPAANQPRPRHRSSLRVAGRPAYHAYASGCASYGDWGSSASSASEMRSVGSPVWSTKPVYPVSSSESPLLAPPKSRRSRSPGERSTSSSSQSRDFDVDVPVQSWGRSDVMESAERSPPRHMSTSPGYPHVFHPGVGSKGPADFSAKTLPRRLRTSMVDVDSGQLRTRASYRRCEEENAPIAKRLRK